MCQILQTSIGCLALSISSLHWHYFDWWHIVMQNILTFGTFDKETIDYNIFIERCLAIGH